MPDTVTAPQPPTDSGRRGFTVQAVPLDETWTLSVAGLPHVAASALDLLEGEVLVREAIAVELGLDDKHSFDIELVLPDRVDGPPVGASDHER